MIKFYRKVKRISQEELSKKSNIELSVLRKIENGDISPNLDQISKIAHSLDIDKYKLAKELLRKQHYEYSEELFIYF